MKFDLFHSDVLAAADCVCVFVCTCVAAADDQC